MSSKKHRGSSDSGEEYRLVYSTDPITKTKQSESSGAFPAGPIKPAVRIERKGRNGKTVTIVAKLPASDAFLKDLCAHLKRALGCGGSHEVSDGQGIIELQGDRREQVVDLIHGYKKKNRHGIVP